MATQTAPAAGATLAFSSTTALVDEVQAAFDASQKLQFVLIGSNEDSGDAGFIRTVAGYNWGDEGTRSGTLTITYNAVPEPSTITLATLALMMLGEWRFGRSVSYGIVPLTSEGHEQ